MKGDKLVEGRVQTSAGIGYIRTGWQPDKFLVCILLVKEVPHTMAQNGTRCKSLSTGHSMAPDVCLCKVFGDNSCCVEFQKQVQATAPAVVCSQVSTEHMALDRTERSEVWRWLEVPHASASHPHCPPGHGLV